MSIKITQVTPCKGRVDAVLKNIDAWLKTDIDQLVLVDYACPQKLTKVVRESGLLERDLRVSVLQVDERGAGPFYDHGHARNMGAHVKPSDYYLFLDADCVASTAVIDTVRSGDQEGDDMGSKRRYGCDVYTTISKIPAGLKYKHVPTNWAVEGQLVVRSSTLMLLNGFWERTPVGWGGETHDFVMRASIAEGNLGLLSGNAFRHDAHSDALRCQHLPRRFKSLAHRDELFKEAAAYYVSRYARSVRAQPGRRLGSLDDGCQALIWYGNTYRRFNHDGDD